MRSGRKGGGSTGCSTGPGAGMAAGRSRSCRSTPPRGSRGASPGSREREVGLTGKPGLQVPAWDCESHVFRSSRTGTSLQSG
ncbi:MAG: hypothetical protein Q6365_017540 [Candidatus Sigynarchaeota archaeon]